VSFSAAELRRALDQDELLVLYQAQVDMRTGAFDGIECAIRWQHPERGRLHAVPFVDDVPAAGLAPDFMRFMARTTTRQVAAWNASGLHVPRYSINAWPVTIGDELIRDMLAACREHGVDPGTFEVETQPEGTYDRAMCDQLQRFRDSGLRVALDDFGEGAIRYGWLRDAPFDVVKVPVMFGKNAGRAYDDAVIIATVAFAKAIGATTVVEGVETTQVRDRVLELGCDIGQGYLWSQQVEAEDFPVVVRALGIDGSTLSTT
jgi:EAL domain-containing protein (putative c-di-GMP-specific phosphodiesterase class I)